MDVSSSSVAAARMSTIVYDTLPFSLNTGARASIELVLYCLCNLSSIYISRRSKNTWMTPYSTKRDIYNDACNSGCSFICSCVPLQPKPSSKHKFWPPIPRHTKEQHLADAKCMIDEVLKM